MSRHANQTNGYNRSLSRPAQVPAANAEQDKATAAKDLELLAKMQKARLPKPPHRHIYINSSCRICGQSEVEST